MTRLAKPGTGKFVRLSKNLMDGTDGVLYPVVGAFAAIGANIAAWAGTFVGTNEYEYLGLLVIPAFYLSTVFAYAKGTKEIPYNNYQFYKRVMEEHMPKFNGHDNWRLAEPMVEQIYRCTLDGHPNKRYNEHCKLCMERESLIKELIPVKPSDRHDIEAAKRFLDMKKEADQHHAEALKELMA